MLHALTQQKRETSSILSRAKELWKSRRDVADKAAPSDPIDQNPSTLLADVPRGVVLWEVSYWRSGRDKVPRLITSTRLVCTVSSHIVKALRVIVRQPDAAEWYCHPYQNTDTTKSYTLRDQMFQYPFAVEFIRCSARALSPPYFKHEHIWEKQTNETFKIHPYNTFTLGQYRIDIRVT